VRQIGPDDLRALATGATILGTGGGGDPYIGLLMAEAAIAANGPVTLLDVDELPEHGLVMPAAMIGAPTVIVEKVPNGTEMRQPWPRWSACWARRRWRSCRSRPAG